MYIMSCSIAAYLLDKISIQHPPSPVISYDYSDLTGLTLLFFLEIEGKGRDMDTRK